MKLAVGILLLAVAAPVGMAETTELSAGPASVAGTFADGPHCVVVAPGGFCPAGYDTAGTLSPGDDRLYGYRNLQRAEVSVVQGSVGPREADVDFDHVVVQHSTEGTVQDAIVEHYNGLPQQARDQTTFYAFEGSTQMYVKGPGVKDGEIGTSEYPVLLFAIPYTNRTRTYTPNTIAPMGNDSDPWMAQGFETMTFCHTYYFGDASCPVAAAAIPLEQAFFAATPAVSLGAQVHEAQASLGAAESRASRTAAGSPSWTRNAGTAEPVRVADAAGAAPLPSIMDAALSPHPGWTREADVETLSTNSGRTGAVPTSGSDVALASGAVVALLALAFALYQRITRARSLEHAGRARMIALASARPGILLGDVAKDLGVDYHTARHHLRILQRCRVIQAVRAGRFVALYPAGDCAVPPSTRAAWARLQRGPLAVALRCVADHPAAGVTELAEYLRCAKSSAHAKLRRLQQHGLVVHGPSGGYALTPAGMEALARMAELASLAADAARPPATTPSTPVA